MSNPTITDYYLAQDLLKDYKICGNGSRKYPAPEHGHGCGKLFKTEDVTKTIQYAQVYYWCKDCYPKIKDD